MWELLFQTLTQLFNTDYRFFKTYLPVFETVSLFVKISFEPDVMFIFAMLGFTGAWKCHREAGAHLAGEPSPHGHWLGSSSGSILQGGVDSEHGTCGQGDHHGGAADLQASQKAGPCSVQSGGSWRSSPLLELLVPGGSYPT